MTASVSTAQNLFIVNEIKNVMSRNVIKEQYLIFIILNVDHGVF